MAVAPKPHTTPPPPAKHPEPPPHEEKAHEKPEPEKVITVGEEQLKRSQAMEAEGVEKWKREHDERKPSEPAKAVPGVGPMMKEDHAGRR